MENQYFIGLDVGTDSVGWAVMSPSYQVCRVGGRSLWGTRLFDAANGAQDRRLARCARRRNKRKKERINLLQSLFANAIAEVDAGFFQRLKDSHFYADDKTINQKYSLFCDPDYSDKDYHTQYPTIYHLRKKLMESTEPTDVRLVYLALHHIIKHRGHFLMEGRSFEESKQLQSIWSAFVQCAMDEMDFDLQSISVDEVAKTLTEQKIKKEKEQDLKQLFACLESKQAECLAKLFSGGNVKLKQLFLELSSDKKLALNFEKDDFDVKMQEYGTELEEHIHFLTQAKAIYDWSVLSRILKNNEWLSDAKIANYEQHKEDLQLLKKVILRNGITAKREMFRSVSIKNMNYCAYIGQTDSDDKAKKNETKKFSKEFFFKRIADDIKPLCAQGDEDALEIQRRINLGIFLPKQISTENGIIPYQLHLEELKAILQNAKTYLPFLNECDQYGSVIDKIEKLFTFRIPFYVGPLNDAHKVADGSKGFCWVVKRSKDKVLPWNFEEIVDKEASANAFMQRLTNKCTYLPTEDVLPKASLLYQRFMVLNEINNLKVHNEPISVELKQRIYEEVFMKVAKVSKKRLGQFFYQQGLLKKGEQDAITGVDDPCTASLSSIRAFKSIFGKDALPDDNVLEEMISLVAKIGMDKNLLQARIKDLLPQASKETHRKICALRSEGWGRLSKTLLTKIRVPDSETGEMLSIMQAMWSQNNNLMQLLSNSRGYAQCIDQYNDQLRATHPKSNDAVDELFVPPAIKRSLRQSLLLVAEIKKIMGKEPAKIFVEVARGGEEKKRTTSRLNALLALYKNCKESSRDWTSELKAKTESDFRSDRLYLYYTQIGKCMYTGDPIDLDDLYNHALYDIDHIYPQSKVVDNSLQNRVLVKKTANKIKSDVYPVDESIQQKMRSTWQMLVSKGLISQEKYHRLTRTTPFDENELAGFINRQLVETRQSTKALAGLLKELYPSARIVYVKARTVSDFRQKYDLPKVRDLNDHHHAKDAYLNAVVGNVYDEKFTQDARSFFSLYRKEPYSMKIENLFSYNLVRHGQTVWTADQNQDMRTVQKTMDKNNVFVTRLSLTNKGEFYNMQPLKKVTNGEKSSRIPLKPSDARLCNVERYGGYNSEKTAYFMLVEHTQQKKGQDKRIRSIEAVPVRFADRFAKDPDSILRYCCDTLQLNEPVLVLSHIKIKSLLKFDGLPVLLAGAQGPQIVVHQAVQLCLNKNEQKTLQMLVKEVERAEIAKAKNQNYDVIPSEKRLNTTKTLRLYDVYLDKMSNTIYQKVLDPCRKKIEGKGRELFQALPLIEQCKVLLEMQYCFQCNAVLGKLEKINGVASSGKKQYNKTISNYSSVQLIHQSITGFYEKAIDLLTL